MKSAVKAGQVYRAKVPRGYRYVRVEIVRVNADPAYVLWREILPSGKNATGWLHGVDRSGQARSHLRLLDGVFHMAMGYELTDLPKKDDVDES